MAVPKYNEMMLPLLVFCNSERKEVSVKEAIEYITTNFKLSKEDINTLLPSGTQTTLYNRVGWAKTYLTKAGLLEKTGRSNFKISNRGVEILKNPPEYIDAQFLKQFDEFSEFQKTNSIESDPTTHEIEISSKDITPEESFEYGYAKIISNLSTEILYRLKNVSPAKFERIVVELLVKMGYGGSLKEAGQVVGKSGDEGIDGIIKEDKLGLDFIYIQAKRWEGVVSRPEIQKFAGALLAKKSKKGIFITTSRFSREAEEYVKNIDANIILIDGEKLTILMIENNLGTAIVNSYEIKKIDNDFYED